MERLVQIRIILTIVITILISNYITAQHQIDKDVTFYLKGKNNFVRLNPFLANCKFDFQNLENCAISSGVLEFQVTPNGKIVSIDVKGNLPSALIEAIKERILLTENKWIFSDAILKKNKNILFYYPVYVEQTEKCNYKIDESYKLLMNFFKRQSVLLVDDGVYMIEPLLWYAAIK